jgi:amino acid transporter
MATAQPATPAQDNQMKRAVGLRALTMISLGSIIGSGWLLGALNASKVAGAASIISWLLAGAVLSVLALVHAELGSTYPVSGGTARFPYMVFGSLGGFTGGWMAFLQAVTIPPIEVEAAEGFLNSKFPSLNLLHTNGTLTGTGILLGLGFMLVFTIINLVGVRWLAETNSIALIWKLLIPTITIFALIIVVFHSSNFSAGGGFAPYGFHGIFAALPLKNIPRAVIGSMIIGVIIYLALEVAFVGALNPHDLVHGWSDPIPGVGAFGPYATLATSAGLGWLSTLLIIDAVVSPAATGLVYLGTSSRLSYGLGRNGYYPRGISRISRSGVPVTSIIICFVVGMLCFLPFPSWTGLVGLVTSATVLMYSFAPLSLAGLRKSDPDRVRAYRLPAAKVLCPLSFVLANFIVYFAGWSNVFWLYMLIILGFIIFVIYQASIPAERRTIIDWRSASWLIPWLLGVAAISWQGQYTSDPNTVFGLTLNNTGNLPTWWDLLVLAFWALVIYYWAVAVSMPTDKVQIAVAEVESEAAAAEELTVAG